MRFRNVCLGVIVGWMLSNVACSKNPAPPEANLPTPSTPTPVNNPPVGKVDNTAGFYARSFEHSEYTYVSHKAITDTNGTPTAINDVSTQCVAAAGELATCYIEAKELDLYMNGVEIQYNIPSDMCTYFKFYPYYYYRLSAGFGPLVVQTDTDATGAVGVDNDSDGAIDTNVIASCPFDHSQVIQGGPNCCEGNYIDIKRTWDTTGTSPGYSVTTNPNAKWGGKLSNCLSGPAMQAETPKTLDGWPVPVITYVAGIGTNAKFVVEAPTQHLRLTLVYPANFFTGGTPYSIAPPVQGAPLPAFQVPSTNPYYDFQCLDRNSEILSEIRVVVRKWNTGPAFDDMINNLTNYNIGGNEPAPWASSPNNDFDSWLDLLTTYPGNLE